MSSYKLVCPHCGHDGTPETAKPPLGSCGFNYLADDVVCREVRASEEGGRLRLSSDFTCQGSRGTNPRLECRSCWQTFAVPEGVQWAIAPEAPPEAPGRPREQAPPGDGDEFVAAANEITKNLAVLIRCAIEDMERVRAGRIDGLEASIVGLTRITEGIAPVAEALAALRAQVVSQGEMEPFVEAKLSALETFLRAQAESQSRQSEQLRNLSALQEDVSLRIEDQAKVVAGLEEQGRLRDEAASALTTMCATLQQAQEEFQKRLDAQAEAIRTLHSAASERIARKEDLQAAVQKLEEIAGALDQVKPLPEEL